MLVSCCDSTLAHRSTSIILSHFILALRQCQDEHSRSTSKKTTIPLAQRVEDGLGGALNSIWGSDNDADESVQELGDRTAQSGEQVEVECTCHGR